MELRRAALLASVALGCQTPDTPSAERVASIEPDSTAAVVLAKAVHLQHRTGDSTAVLDVLGFARDSLGVTVSIYPRCSPGRGCLGGGTRTRIWRGDSATLIGLER